MPILSDVGLPGGGEPNGPQRLPSVRDAREYKHAAHRAASLGLFASLALGVAFASRGMTGLVVFAGIYVALFATLRWAVLREREWARPAAVIAFGVLGVVMIVSALGSAAMLLGREDASVAQILAMTIVWFGGGVCLLVFPKGWFTRT